ncbi:MAG: RMD1 family protein [Polyangiales bacterium]|nr:RMD1 family protein [Myxococcales bacterium]
MKSLVFPVDTPTPIRATYAGQRIEFRALLGHPLATSPLVLETGTRGLAVIFKYGVIVLVNVNANEEEAILQEIRPSVQGPFANPQTEPAELRVTQEGNERAQNGTFFLQEVTLEKIQIIADVLAKSVVLAHYESAVHTSFDQVEPLAENLKQRGRLERRSRALLQHIGEALLVETRTVGRVEVSEKPEVLWERPDLEALYARLADEYELVERQTALERKLNLIARTTETLLNLLQHDRSHRVEWYIVALIAFEILFGLVERFLWK